MKHRSWRNTGFQPTSLIAGVLLLLIVFVSVGYFFFLAEPRLSAEQQAELAGHACGLGLGGHAASCKSAS